MNLLPVCVLYSQDKTLQQKVSGYLGSVASVRAVDQAGRLEFVVQQFDPVLLLFDLRGDGWRELLGRLRATATESIVVALGCPRSAPALEAAGMGVYSVEDYDIERQELQSVVARAQAHLKVIQENRLLRKEATRLAVDRRETDAMAAPMQTRKPWQHFSQAFRNFDDVDAMLDRLVEGVSTWARVSRVGIFAMVRGSESFRLRAGIRCLDNAHEMEVTDVDPLVRWMQMHAHLISRLALPHVDDSSEKMLLEHSLDTLGAEVIAPLHGRNRIIGWLFVGHHVTGRPFNQNDLEDLMLLSEHVSNTLENALLYEEVAVQKTLAETLLHSIPVGIVAAGSDGTIRWFNAAAEHILDASASEVMNAPVRGNLPGPLAGLLMACIRGETTDEPVEWAATRTNRSLSIAARRLEINQQCLGGVLIIRDLTKEKLLREKQQELERAAFWTELSAAMSHEIRNPLVAISTFAQLLPERYSDGEFRREFSELVSREIGRLNGMIEQIDAFANPPKLQFLPVDVEKVLLRSIESAKRQHGGSGGVNIKVQVEKGLPPVEGDESALVDCFAHLALNALEAVVKSSDPVVVLKAGTELAPAGCECVVQIRDNGRGIPDEMREKVFSPFCTRKARGIGLGLPLVKRTVADHRGRIAIESDRNGASVTIGLPAARVAERARL